jgi:hypothetical protein
MIVEYSFIYIEMFFRNFWKSEMLPNFVWKIPGYLYPGIQSDFLSGFTILLDKIKKII